MYFFIVQIMQSGHEQIADFLCCFFRLYFSSKLTNMQSWTKHFCVFWKEVSSVYFSIQTFVEWWIL